MTDDARHCSLCCGCQAEPARLPRQRYGKKCHGEAQRKYRAKQREELRRLRQLAKAGGACDHGS